MRALANALLDDEGAIGIYVSLEQLIIETADDDDAALLQPTHRWHDLDNDVWPWVTYFVDVLARAYERFEQRASADRSSASKQDRAREYVTEHAPQVFKTPTSEPRCPHQRPHHPDWFSTSSSVTA